MADDAVVIGSGINGLVAANLLARKGWRVTVLERNSVPGGALATEELTVPGYLHDTFSAWHGTFRGGPAWPLLGADLVRHGLEYVAAEGLVTATARRDGSLALLHRDPATTASLLGEEDGPRYLRQLERNRVLQPAISSLMGQEVTVGAGIRAGWHAWRGVGRRGLLPIVRDGLSGSSSWAQRTFAGPDVDALVSPWLLHAGLTPHSAPGAVIGMMMLAGLHGSGMPIPRGGSARLSQALCALLKERGGRVLTDMDAEEILVEGGRAVGVLAQGQTFATDRAVLASVTPGALYGRLLGPGAPVPDAVRREAQTYRHGRGAMQLHVALDGPAPWRDERLSTVPLIHLSEGSAGVALACAQAEAGLLPSRPTVVVGQPTVLDPSRAPAGGSILWIQLQEAPYRPVGDGASSIEDVDGWDERVTERYTARVLDMIAEHAPGLHNQILGTAALTPVDLERRNPNFVNGDPYGGSLDLDQSLLWRPLPSAARHRAPVPGLWHIGASTHPGPGLAGASGAAAARSLLRRPGRAH